MPEAEVYGKEKNVLRTEFWGVVGKRPGEGVWKVCACDGRVKLRWGVGCHYSNSWWFGTRNVPAPHDHATPGALQGPKGSWPWWVHEGP